MLTYTTRPISDRTPFGGEPEHSPFSVKWSQALALLEHEIRMIDGADVVIEVDVTESQIRRDGMVRHGAVAASNAVRVAFTSRYGPMQYALDRYEKHGRHGMESWQHNVYAIAKTLQALRAVDRYGATADGQQYRGYLQIEGPAADEPATTPDEAVRWLHAFTDLPSTTTVATLVRRARRLAHPDTGGLAEDWHRVQHAALILGVDL